jgi:nicotinate-nucleotide pyrophosphorylase (carboxylating)
MGEHAATRILIRLALEEDIGKGDLTALAVPPEVRATAKLIAKQELVLSGLPLVELVLDVFGGDIRFSLADGVADGQEIPKGQTILTFEGRARDLLTVERTVLNFLQHTSGVATQARVYKKALQGAKLQVLDTRKTQPGLRFWEKKAVRDGGLHNHRQRLDDGVLLKENHIRASGSITLAMANLQGKISAEIPVEVEVTSWEEALEAIHCGVRRLLLDNFTPAQLKELVPRLRDQQAGIFLEASGGIHLGNLVEYAGTGVDAVSIGALTHSVKAVDLSLLFEFQ